jgi:oligopeptide/dipeptide ABC transporter ATP-binding protein
VSRLGDRDSGSELLKIEGLRIEFDGAERTVGVQHASVSVSAGTIVGLVGESGSGKSLTCRAVSQLIPRPGRIASGSVTLAGQEVVGMSRRELQELRAHTVGMVFQDPFTALNPTRRIGAQLTEVLRLNLGMPRAASRDRAIELLGQMEIPEPERRFDAYPHELSGGMRQRVMIALAIAPSPTLLIADEPTTALDVTTQAQILKLIVRLRDEVGMSVLFVSHDMGVVAQICDGIHVMYGGHVVEAGEAAAVLARPQHPYTRALLQSVPSIESAATGRHRAGIPGRPPARGEELPGCPFAPRCRFAESNCTSVPMTLESFEENHRTACPVVRFATDGRRHDPRHGRKAVG